MGCKVSSYRVGGGMTSSTISLAFNDTAQKTVFTATEKCILKLTLANRLSSGNLATFNLNNTLIGVYNSYYNAFEQMNKSLANLLAGVPTDDPAPITLVLYLEEGDTVYATRTTGNAFTISFYSAVFTF